MSPFSVPKRVRNRPPFRRNFLAWQSAGEEEGDSEWSAPIGGLSEEDIRTLRFSLAWLPLFGAGLQISYMDTLDLGMDEAVELLEKAVEERTREVKTAFKGKR